MAIETYAKVICDSISPLGIRLTSIEVQFPRFVLPQILMHRQWSRSCESLRARPTKSKLEEVADHPVVPTFARNQKGMVAGDVLSPQQQEKVKGVWYGAMEAAVAAAEELHQLGVAKQWANRLLEPFAYQKVLVTATDFDNFFRLRCADDAQPEIQELACKMKESLEASEPVQRTWDHHHWHLPYVDGLTLSEIRRDGDISVEEKFDAIRKVSAARCARVSYCTHDGHRDFKKDLGLAAQLLKDSHSNPFEHCCTPASDRRRYANLKGWVSYRYLLEQAATLPNPEG